MFRIGDKIVHPMHGAGIVDQIVTRKVNGVLRDYYSLKLAPGGYAGDDPHGELWGDRRSLYPQRG